MRIAVFVAMALAACGTGAVEDEASNAVDVGWAESGNVNQNGAETSEEALLVLRFPDGARGGRGKIQGTGPVPANGMNFNWNQELLDQVRDCGGEGPRFDVEVTHSVSVLTRSTARDRNIVQCLKERSFLHFTPTVRYRDPNGVWLQDESRFEDLFDRKAGR